MSDRLLDWALNYVKQKDLLLRKVKSIRQEAGRIVVQYPDREVFFIPMAVLSVPSQQATVITYNSKRNFDFLLGNWRAFADRKTTIMLINPESKLDDKWVIAPHIHERVCDSQSLKQGLVAMQSMVETIAD